MRKRVLASCTLVLVVFAPASAFAWGFAGHKLIMRRAIEILPDIHARFERDLIERFESRLTLTPAAPTPIASARDAAFEALLASYLLVDPILKADTEAIAGKDTYDDDYFERFFSKTKTILEQRLSAAITATASMIVGAWDQAGRPVVRLNDPRPVQKVRSPR